MSKSKEIVKFIEKFKAAKTSTINTIFYNSLRYTQSKLKKMTEYGELQRVRDYYTFEYIYYVGSKPRQMRHRLLLTDFYAKMTEIGIDIVLFENEYSEVPNIRPDGFVAYSYNNSNYIAFIETERSNKLDIDKYKKLYKSGDFFKRFPNAQSFPRLIAVTDKKVTPIQEFKVVKIKEDFSNISNLIQG